MSIVRPKGADKIPPFTMPIKVNATNSVSMLNPIGQALTSYPTSRTFRLLVAVQALRFRSPLGFAHPTQYQVLTFSPLSMDIHHLPPAEAFYKKIKPVTKRDVVTGDISDYPRQGLSFKYVARIQASLLDYGYKANTTN